MASKCTKCGNTENYNFTLNIGMCDICIGKELERAEELEQEIAKRPAKPLYGEARSLLLKAMDNSANVDDAIEKYKRLKEQIKELETKIEKLIEGQLAKTIAGS